MILFENNLFLLENNEMSYVIGILESNHIANLHFGGKVKLDFSELRHQFEQGSSTSYNDAKPYSLGNTLLEVGGYGKGDYREPSILLKGEHSNSDFKYKSHIIKKGKENSLPGFNNECDTLIIFLLDEIQNVEVELHYNVYDTVITRSTRVVNTSGKSISIRKVMSMNLDFADSDFQLLTLNGAWIRERHVHLRKLFGTTRIDSKKGVSSADHNPFFGLSRTGEEHYGDTYGFGLVYSGNFEMIAEVNSHDLLRVQLGINSFDFDWTLSNEEVFETPEVVMTFSSKGLNGMSQNFHEAIKKKFLRGQWKDKLRPVKVNNWEATYFDFNEKKLLKIANEAAALGVELFVLDDGWFGNRDDDTTSLGDYHLNKKKIKDLSKLADKINKKGLMFGIWVEPEMISVESELFNKHPEWAITIPGVVPSLGRNQLVLDFTNREVIEHVYNELKELFSSANIEYVKWDMNRNFSDVYGRTLKNQGEFYHRYVLGLYELLDKLTEQFPDILFESCSSGGNRFDLGMLYYMPQTWVSDNTDAYERQHIQYGTSMIFPQCTMSNHVSASPNHQTFRQTSLETRFNVACFGVLGYELDLTTLTSIEKKTIKKQIEWYKLYRETLQFGSFERVQWNDDLIWTSKGEDILVGHYQGLHKPNSGYQLLKLPNLNSSIYHVHNREQFIDARVFGSHINTVLPFKVKVNGHIHTLICNHYMFGLEKIEMFISGDTIKNRGIDVGQRFIGTGYNETVRINEDFSSRLYILKEHKNE